MSEDDGLAERVEALEEQPSLTPVEVAALRRVLHRGARAALDDPSEAEKLSPVEKADVILERLTALEQQARDLSDRTHLQGLFSGDGATKRARKVAVMEHLLEKAQRSHSGKTHLKTETVAAIAEVSERHARNYMDDLAAEVPGCHTKQGEDVGDGKQLRIDLAEYGRTAPHAEGLPPRGQS